MHQEVSNDMPTCWTEDQVLIAMVLDFIDAPLPAGNVDSVYETDWRKIVKIDSMERPGLSEREFFGLFVKCDVCELVMAREVFCYHDCVPRIEDSMELTDVEE
jgi:hypothetical protein